MLVLGLPDIDGLSFLRQLKATPQFQRIPVIVETALTDDENIREEFSAGAYYYLTKPLNADLLVCIVNIAVEEYRSERTPSR